MASLSWSYIAARLAKTISADEFKRWILPLQVECREDPRQDAQPRKTKNKQQANLFLVFIKAENKFKLNWVKNHYDPFIQDIVIKMCKKEQLIPKIVYDYDRKKSSTNIKTGKSSGTTKSLSPIKLNASSSIELFSSVLPQACFTNFIDGDVNRVAKNVAFSIPDDKQHLGHLFIFYGNSGLGKSHLLQAVANEVLKKTQSMIYVGGEVFIRALYHYLAKNEMEQFKEVYRHVDVLMLDDMHFLKGKPKAQEEFLHTLNARERKKKTLVLATDVAPKRMDYFSDALRSRLTQALAVKLDKPNAKTCRAIICQKCEEEHLELSEPCLNQIVSKVSGNVREIEGILKLVKFYVGVHKRPADLPMLKTVFKNMGGTRSREPTLDEIRKLTEKHYNLSAGELKRRSRQRTTATARQMAMFLCRQLTSQSTTEIGLAFSRGHTAVIHSLERIQSQMVTDDRVKCDYDAIYGKVENLLNINRR